MTAYGKGDCVRDGKRFMVEIKSLNNRYRDVVLRLPRNLQGFEKELRSLIDKKIRRGRIEVFFQNESSHEAPPYALELNLPLVDAYLKIFEQLSSRSGIKQEIPLETLLQMNDVVNVKTDTDDEEETGKSLHETLSLGLDSLIDMRQKEGAAIEVDLRKRLKRIEGFVKDVRARIPEIAAAYRVRLMENRGETVSRGFRWMKTESPRKWQFLPNARTLRKSWFEWGVIWNSFARLSGNG